MAFKFQVKVFNMKGAMRSNTNPGSCTAIYLRLCGYSCYCFNLLRVDPSPTTYMFDNHSGT